MTNLKVLVVGGLEQDVYFSQVKGLKVDFSSGGEAFNQIRLDDILIANEMNVFSGGTGANVAITLSRWGIDAAVLAPLGRDGAGSQIMRDLDAENIDSSLVQLLPDYVTACNHHLYDRGSHRQTVVYYPSDWSKFDLSQINFFDYKFTWAYVATTGGEFALLDELFRKLKLAGRKILFNPGEVELSSMNKCWGLFEDVDILLVNRQEAEIITQDETLDGSVEKLTAFVDLAVITGAEDGVIVSDGRSIWRAGIYQKVSPIDRTGVGDAFGAGFLAKYIQTNDITTAITYGSANAASVVGQIGGNSGVLSPSQKISTIAVRERSIK